MSTMQEKREAIIHSLGVLKKRLAKLRALPKLEPMQEVELKKIITAIDMGEALLNGVQ